MVFLLSSNINTEFLLIMGLTQRAQIIRENAISSNLKLRCCAAATPAAATADLLGQGLTGLVYPGRGSAELTLLGSIYGLPRSDLCQVVKQYLSSSMVTAARMAYHTFINSAGKVKTTPNGFR